VRTANGVLVDEHHGNRQGDAALRVMVAVFVAPSTVASEGCAARRTVTPSAEFPKT
jgi:hypothetical protein